MYKGIITFNRSANFLLDAVETWVVVPVDPGGSMPIFDERSKLESWDAVQVSKRKPDANRTKYYGRVLSTIA